MKKCGVLIGIVLIISCVSARAQSFFGAKNGPTAVAVAELSDTLNNTSSLFYWQDRLWTLNDHGNIVFYAIDSVTGTIDTVLDTGLPIVDMEEVTQDEDYFYIGDFGNNHPQLRSELYIYRLSKANLLSGNFVVDTTVFLYYGYNPMAENEYEYLPTTDFDCEAMVASGDSLYLFTKQWTSMQTACYVLPKQPGTYTAARCGRYNVEGMVTGAWLHPENCLLVLCGYNIVCQPFVSLFYSYQGNAFFEGESQRVALANGIGTQTEAITSLDGLHYYLTHESFRNLGGNLPPHLLSLDLTDYLFDYFYPDTTGTDTGGMVGIDALGQVQIEAYPNPATDVLTVEIPLLNSNMRNAFLVMYDTSGREVLRQPVTGETMRISVKELPLGHYVLRVLCSDGVAAAVKVGKM